MLNKYNEKLVVEYYDFFKKIIKHRKYTEINYYIHLLSNNKNEDMLYIISQMIKLNYKKIKQEKTNNIFFEIKIPNTSKDFSVQDYLELLIEKINTLNKNSNLNKFSIIELINKEINRKNIKILIFITTNSDDHNNCLNRKISRFIKILFSFKNTNIIIYNKKFNNYFISNNKKENQKKIQLLNINEIINNYILKKIENKALLKWILNLNIFDKLKFLHCIFIYEKIKEKNSNDLDNLIKNDKNVKIIITSLCIYIIYIKIYEKIKYKLLLKSFIKSIYNKKIINNNLRKFNLKFNTSFLYENLFINNGKDFIIPLQLYNSFISNYSLWNFEFNNKIHVNTIVIKSLRFNKLCNKLIEINFNNLFYEISTKHESNIFDEMIKFIYENLLYKDVYNFY